MRADGSGASMGAQVAEEQRGYGQYCPIARSAEILGERWSLLIVRDLLVGTTRFNDLARGLPGLSRSLLTKRLRQLRAAGVIDRVGGEYVLTPAGQDLETVVFGLGEWGARWAFGDPRENELDPELLLWWAHTRIDTGQLPSRRVVIEFNLSAPTFRAWLVIDDAGTSVCKADPGFEIDARVTTEVATLARVWLGRIGVTDALRSGAIDLIGQQEVVDALPSALELSPVAPAVHRAHEALAE